MPKRTKDSRVKAELKRLHGFFEDVDEKQRETVGPLIQNAAFMRVLLEDLQETINEDGATELYQNGSRQYGRKPSAAMQAYNATVKNYASIIKALCSLLPKGPLTEEKLQEFIASFKEC